MTRVALVTGGNKGIGRETARRLAEAGQKVYIGARDETRGRAAAEELGVGFVHLDVTDDDSVAKAAAELEHKERRLDVLVNNAGIREPSLALDDDGVPKPFKTAAEMTASDALEVFETNVFGIVRVIHVFLPMLSRSENPAIVNISSGMGSFAAVTDPDRGESQVSVPLYSASKAAVSMLTVQYAKLLPQMRVNAVDPGLTATDFTGNDGHSVTDATGPVVSLATAGADSPTGSFLGVEGPSAW